MTAHSAGTAATDVRDDSVRELESAFRGTLVRPADEDYDTVRQVWNGMVDKRPALIARCAGAADVISAVNFAREQGLPVAVRGGGHNVAGSGVCDDGLVIDLSPMNGVRVDPGGGTVRAEGGVTIGDLDHETQAFGLAVPMGVVTATGIAGLTLGGGIGWLRRRHGLSSDNLISADVVTADGRLIIASAEENADLLWGLQGGGGNFGVVTSFEYRAHPVGPDVFLAFVVHAGTDAAEALRFYREWAGTAPDEVSSFAILWHAPEIDEIPAEHHHAPIVVYLAVHSGDGAHAQQDLASLREFGSPIADLSDTLPYLEVQQFFDADYPAHEMRYYWKSHHLAGLPDDAITALVDLNENSPSLHSTLDVWQLGGAFGRPGPGDTAFGDRSAPFLLGIESNWERPEDDDACVEWGRAAFRALEPFSTGAQYLNFPGLYEDPDEMLRGSFGANFDRLVACKNRYDPTNLFRLNPNIPPT
ncbi:FAD-binding oxidoreductase [Pseudonocardia sp. H11422]|uniref:FAD-binding oxidoreductase n=1 Tax=Pseudonocardia sp. H11422 TaxID=2835866 RepID=UPI001BDBFCEA|nr:FAD-binding oxidoreductase [Pseudonocardia sp. H11422]